MALSFSRRFIVKGAATTALAAGVATPFARASPPETTSTPAPNPTATATAASAAPPAGPKLGPARPFSFEALKARARALSEQPATAQAAPNAALLETLDYDSYQKIRIRSESTLQLGATPIQFFHLGKYFKEPVRIHVLQGSTAREVLYSVDLFDMPSDHPARGLPQSAGFAGFRVMNPDLKSDWLSFLGASYFRASGPYNQYGLSARALSIDTGLDPEEFPRFSEFWLEPGKDQSLVIYALLESPSLTGAYRIATRRQTDSRDIHRTSHDISLELYARKDVNRLGLAPFSSMFWYGEGSRKQAADWRPEVHDSDGLAIWTGAGERLWRPLNNPPRVMTNSFLDRDVRGFGLLQRDRDFVSYLDDGVFYERRASVWVEPGSGWGRGAVQLLEIPTDDEIHDNIAAWWNPESPLKAGEHRAWSYRLTWLDDIPFPANLARATAAFSGLAGRPGQQRPKGQRKYVLDFQGSVFGGLGAKSGVVIDATTSRGEIAHAYSHPVVGQRHRWRALFDIKATGAEPAEIRVFLKRNGKPLTETVLLQHFPDA